MTKLELVKAIADQSGLTKTDAAKALDATTDTIIKTLSKGDSVTLIGFGTFLSRKRSARTGRNPQTGEKIQIKASKVPAFKAGKGFKDAVN